MRSILSLCFGIVISQLFAQDTLTIAFGSCNKPSLPQDYWNNIQKHNPQHFFWLGDNIYGDSEDMTKLRKAYTRQLTDSFYANFKENVTIDGTWDDHDYGVNDGGAGFPMKKESKDELIYFLGFNQDHPIHNHEGVYYSKTISLKGITIKALFLDTRSFRSDLARNPLNPRRYTTSDTGTMLGNKQWQWVQDEMADSTIDLYIIVSSVQVIANEHWFEKWGNLPHERERLINLCKDKPVIILSGDRHIAEISRLENGKNPLIDVTSSGLTHTWRSYRYEANEHRLGKQFAVTNFGLLQLVRQSYGFDVRIEFRESYTNQLLQLLVLQYPD